MDDQIKGSFEHLEKIIGHNYTNLTKTLDKLEQKIGGIENSYIKQGNDIIAMEKDIGYNKDSIDENRLEEKDHGKKLDERIGKVEKMALKTFLIASGSSGLMTGLVFVVKSLIK